MDRKVLSIIALIGFAVLAVIFLKGHTHELVKIFEVSLNDFFILLALSVFISLYAGFKLKMLMNLYGVNLEFKEWCGLAYINHLGNYITPFRGGASMKAIYLKQKYNFPYTFSASIMGADYIISFLSYGLLGIFLCFIIPISDTYKWAFGIVFTVIFLIGLACLFLLPFVPKTDIKILKYAVRSVHELKRLYTNKSVLLKLVLLDIFGLFIVASRIYYSFKAYDTYIPFSICLIAGSLSTFSLLISITPMGLGIQESISVFIAKILGISALIGAYSGILVRGVSIITVFIIGSIFSYILLKKMWFKNQNKQIA